MPILGKEPIADPGEEINHRQSGNRRQQLVVAPRQLLPEQTEGIDADMEVAGDIHDMQLRHEVVATLAIIGRIKIGIVDIDVLNADILGELHVVIDLGITNPAITIVKNLACFIFHNQQYNNKRPR